MNEKNTEKLFKDFPEFFDDRKKGMMVSLMGFGFECSDGWFDLIYNLCSDIKEWYLNNESNHHNDETNEIELKKGIPKHFQVQQVKEKFGSLRFYISAAPQAIHDMIHKVENRSYYICEECGKDITKINYGDNNYHSFYRDELSWIRTLCDECLKKFLEKRRLPIKDYISDWQKEHNSPFVER